MAVNSELRQIKDDLLTRLLYNCSATRCDFAESVREIDREMSEERTAFRIRPVAEKEMSAIDVSRKLLSAMYGKSPRTHSFELWYDDLTSFVFTIAAADVGEFQTFTDMFFPEADIMELGTSLPPIKNGEYVASARLSLENDYFLQILNPSGPTELRRDPYNDIVQELNAAPNGTRVAIQVAFRRAPDKWWTCQRRSFGDWSDDGPSCEELTETMTSPTIDEWTKTILRGQESDQAFVTDLRLFAISENQEDAADTAMDVARRVARSYNDPKMNQGFRASGIPSFMVRQELERFVRRDVRSHAELLGDQKRRPCILTLPELAAVAHVPSCISYEEFKLTASDVDWKEPPIVESSE